MIKVLAITGGFSPLVPELKSCNKLSVVGVLNCFSSDKLESFANEHDIPYKILEKQDILLAQWIEEKSPDVIVTFRLPFLLKKEIFSIPRYGSMNIHPSLLPKYRGPNPWFWIYYNMEAESGVTIHKLKEKEDNGDIVCQQKFIIPIGSKLDDLRIKSTEIGIKLMLDVLYNIENVTPIPQPISSPTVRARNIESYQDLIDWQNWPVSRIWHMLNGFPDILESNADYLSLNKKLKVQRYARDVINIQTGSFIFVDGSYILKCCDGIIFFEEKDYYINTDALS